MRDIRYQIAINRQRDNDLTNAAAEIEVQQTIEGPTTFRIKFAIDICDGEFNLIDDERLNPGMPDTEVTILAWLDTESYVLAHGIITERKVNLVEGGSGSALEIQCEDRRRVMDRVQRNTSHQGRASDVARQILESYGFETDVADTQISYEENGTTLNQTESDLAFITTLAGRNDVRFWIDWTAETGLMGFDVTETAHFKPSPPRPASNPLGFTPPLLLAPEKAAVLKMNTGGSCSNVVSFQVQSNAEAPNQSGPIERVDSTSGEVTEMEAPGATNESLGEQPPAPAAEPRTRRLTTAGDAQEALVRTQAALNDASWSVQATAETSVQALDAIVAPHQIIKVTGAGNLNSGDYFVKAVSHMVDSSAHKMRIEMLRNALGGIMTAELLASAEQTQPPYFGKYRGTVVDNIDPIKKGRLRVTVPAVLSSTEVWASPCVPYAGPSLGFYAMPDVGTGIWVEFEAGDPNYPIWTGCFWNDNDIDQADADPKIKFFKTKKFTLRIDDGNGEIIIENDSGSQIKLTAREILHKSSTVKQEASGGRKTELSAASFKVNDGSMEVL